MKKYYNPRDNKAYRAKQQALHRKAKKLNLPCSLCGERINYLLPYHHKYAFTADHVQPINKGGKVLGVLKPAHRSCNSKKGDRIQIHQKLQELKEIKTLNNW